MIEEIRVLLDGIRIFCELTTLWPPTLHENSPVLRSLFLHLEGALTTFPDGTSLKKQDTQ
ncbi:hypothetical protein [Pseudomonas frederiksbergensis]|uniref:hypothetical protein n=1 Tax=Pseudomonas frederiksbergensis TaxID=104087 RepID=UPI0011CD9610|nr:hypothetical protein [Pseudomonas frederiksbergensis]